jgi:hypothetical protein
VFTLATCGANYFKILQCLYIQPVADPLYPYEMKSYKAFLGYITSKPGLNLSLFLWRKTSLYTRTLGMNVYVTGLEIGVIEGEKPRCSFGLFMQMNG